MKIVYDIDKSWEFVKESPGGDLCEFGEEKANCFAFGRTKPELMFAKRTSVGLASMEK